ncbi:MAG: hypothetical protein K9H25_16950 [Rhodospirillum sp.]|nr:hypothetical protein [Rhodospirillum sp.]MCF8489113.1 hypothetical protein [Rhodospirillum sp.]MCF8498903.1 hypothetical protein [Rhodospirillum sp.]
MNARAKSAVFLSIRDKAKRLPGKVVRDIKGRKAVEHLIDRIKTAQRPDLVVMTTSVHPDDDGLERIARDEGIECFRGSEEDKLVRYLDAADQYGVEFFAVVDGDDLFCDAAGIDQIIEAYDQDGGDYIIVDHLPLGATAFGVRTEAMRDVVARKEENDTEVWGACFTENPEFEARLLDPRDERLRKPDIRMTLDYQEDLDFFSAVFDALYREGTVFSFGAIMDLLEQRPEIVALNQGMKEKYALGLSKAREIRLKPR